MRHEAADVDEGEDGSMKKWIKIHIAAWLCLVAIFPALIICALMGMPSEGALSVLLSLIIAWIVLLRKSFKVRKQDADVMETPKEQAKAEKRRIEEERKLKERQQKLVDNWPVSAVIVTTQDKTKNKSGLGSAVVGHMIAGPVGAVVGASVGKKTVVTGQTVTFSVKYQSGRTGIETVEVGSERFNFLSSLLLK